MSRADMSPAAVAARIQQVGRLADLAPERRLATKVSMDPDEVGRRIARLSALRDLCLALALRSATPGE